MQLKNIVKGTVVKVWTGRRGHDYVVVGQDIQNKRLLLIKNNCLTMEGGVHASTKHFHIKLPYTRIGNNYIVSGITRILGHKNISHYDFSRLIENTSYTVLPQLLVFKTSVLDDNTIATTF